MFFKYFFLWNLFFSFSNDKHFCTPLFGSFVPLYKNIGFYWGFFVTEWGYSTKDNGHLWNIFEALTYYSVCALKEYRINVYTVSIVLMFGYPISIFCLVTLYTMALSDCLFKRYCGTPSVKKAPHSVDTSYNLHSFHSCGAFSFNFEFTGVPVYFCSRNFGS